MVDDLADGAGMIGGAAAAGADDGGAGLEGGGDGLGHGRRGLFVDGLHILEDGQSGVGLDHDGEGAVFAVDAGDLGGAVHVHAGAAVEGDEVGAAFRGEGGGAVGVDAHHGDVEGAVGGEVVGEGGDDGGGAGGLGGGDSDAEFLEGGLGFDDDGIGAGLDEGEGLFVVDGLGLVLGHIAVRFEDGAEGAEVAEHAAGAVAEGLAGDADSGLVDGADVVGVAVAGEDSAAAAEGIGDEAIGAGFGVAALDLEDAFRVGEVPVFATAALFEAGEHELGAHGAVADEAAVADEVVEWGWGGHGWRKISVSVS